MFMDHAFGQNTGIWEESNQKWDEVDSSWKIVGYDPRQLLKSEMPLHDISTDQIDMTRNKKFYWSLIEDEIFNKPSIEYIFDRKEILNNENSEDYSEKIDDNIQNRKKGIIYTVISELGKTYTAIANFVVEVGSFVIIEADRGEDCLQVKDVRESIGSEGIKKILRKANERDIEILMKKNILETKAIEKCNILVKNKKLEMKITGCEFQWDMKKITFYFHSDKRIDFRDLVNDLFKYFKVRIWMSMVNRK